MSQGGSPRVVDFSTHLSGPLASHLLTEMGADVVKIERPGVGDGNRGLDPLIAGRGMFHAALNSGARSLAVHNRSPYWNDIVAAAARWADAVIVGLRPVDAQRRGLDFATLRVENPTLVYCLVSGFGERGPWADYTAHGQTIDALAGQVPIEWHDGLPSTQSGWRSSGAVLAGVFAALGVLAGLYRRERGEGAQHVSASLWGSAMWWNWRDLNTYANLGQPWNEYRELGARYAMYPTADDRAVLLAPIERKFWHRLCDILDLPDEWRERGSWERSAMEFGRGPEHADERPLIAERMRQKPLDEWWPALEESGIPFAPVLTVEEALRSEHAAAEGVMRGTRVLEEDVLVSALPMRLSDSAEGAGTGPLDPLSPAPELGADARSVLADLGLEGIEDELGVD
ncbi:MAG: CoA transferase [Actinobacteria bacterium]|nr:CoA transferase [Actinomycetota bacterium]